MRTLIISAGLSFLLLCPAGAKHLAVAKPSETRRFPGNQQCRMGPIPRIKEGHKRACDQGRDIAGTSIFFPRRDEGRPGENLTKAIAAFAEAQGKATSTLDRELWDKLVSMSADPVIVDYTISEADVRGPFLEKIPGKMERMKDLPHLFYTSPKEELAEKFHMSPELLSELNPAEKFDVAGRTIAVANIPAKPLPAKVNRIEVDKTRQELKRSTAMESRWPPIRRPWEARRSRLQAVL